MLEEFPKWWSTVYSGQPVKVSLSFPAVPDAVRSICPQQTNSHSQGMLLEFPQTQNIIVLQNGPLPVQNNKDLASLPKGDSVGILEEGVLPGRGIGLPHRLPPAVVTQAVVGCL